MDYMRIFMQILSLNWNCVCEYYFKMIKINKTNDEKGDGVFIINNMNNLNNINMGVEILKESPLVSVLDTKFLKVNCSYCFIELKSFKKVKCDECGIVYYCSKLCLKKDHELHQKECNYIQNLLNIPKIDMVFILRVALRVKDFNLDKFFYIKRENLSTFDKNQNDIFDSYLNRIVSNLNVNLYSILKLNMIYIGDDEIIGIILN